MMTLRHRDTHRRGHAFASQTSAQQLRSDPAEPEQGQVQQLPKRHRIGATDASGRRKAVHLSARPWSSAAVGASQDLEQTQRPAVVDEEAVDHQQQLENGRAVVHHGTTAPPPSSQPSLRLREPRQAVVHTEAERWQRAQPPLSVAEPQLLQPQQHALPRAAASHLPW